MANTNRKATLALLPFVFVLAGGCSSPEMEIPQISIFNEHSRVYYNCNIDPKRVLELPTYHWIGDKDVPYVTLEDFLPIASSNYRDGRTLTLQKDENLFKISLIFQDTSYPLMDFDPASHTVTIQKGYKQWSGFFAGEDPFLYQTSDVQPVCLPNKAKNEIDSIFDSREISLSKYGFSLLEQNGQIYAPAGMLAELFGLTRNPSKEHSTCFLYNGKDYFLGDPDYLDSCYYSSRLTFDLAEPGYESAYIQAGVSLTYNLCGRFSQVFLSTDVKYCFETKVLPGKTIELKGGHSVELPSFKIRLVLNKDGTGDYLYINTQDGQSFELPELNMLHNQTVTYVENDEYLDITIAVPNESGSGMEAKSHRINKKETSFLKTSRTNEIARYDYNVTRLHFGEFYGLTGSREDMKDLDAFFAPYESKLLSTNYLDYNLAMSELLYKGIDDGHTKPVEFARLSGESGIQSQIDEVSSYIGPRRSILLSNKSNYLTMREENGVTPGYQIVDGTAYLTFDHFMTNNLSFSKYTQEPDSYLQSDTVGFTYAALEDIVNNHPEVERVVYDITCNGGGSVGTLSVFLATMSQDVNISFENGYAGEELDLHYLMDLNGDRRYGDELDTYAGRIPHFYILESPFSFSCANAFASFAQSSDSAIIIGKRSGGGSCVVDNVTTPCGYSYVSSSMLVGLGLDDTKENRINNDEGVIPDIEIDESLWYDRAGLSAFLRQIEGN